MTVHAKACSTCGELSYVSDVAPPEVLLRIEAIRTVQKGKVFYLTDAPAHHLDMIADVPVFNWALDYKAMADKILQYGLGMGVVSEWQRDIIDEKLENIAKWWESHETSLVNNAVLSFKDTIERPVKRGGQIATTTVRIREANAQQYGSKQLVTIEIGNWLSTVCPAGHEEAAEGGGDLFFDRCQQHDCDWHKATWRPAYIIDGQHRIRGIQRPPSRDSAAGGRPNEETIPVAILGYGETLDHSPIPADQQAKIFTEISAKATPLDEHHRLFLFYVFKTGVPQEDMSVPASGTNPLRQAYETVLRLASSTISGNPFEDRIKILVPRTGGVGRTTCLRFERALYDWFRPWFSTGGIWQGVDTTNAAKEIIGLAQAIRAVWAGNGPVSGAPYWQPDGPPAPGGIFSHGSGGDMSAFLRLFLDLYPVVRSQVANPSKVNFQNFLRQRLYDPETPIGRLAFDGAGWDEIRSPDKNYGLLKSCVRDIIEGGGRVEYDLDNHPSQPRDFNAYLTLDPCIYAVETTFGPVPDDGSPIIVEDVPDRIWISWRTPMLARPEISVAIRSLEAGELLRLESVVSDSGGVGELTLRESDGHYDRNQPGLIVEFSAANHKGVQDEPFVVKFDFGA